MGDQRHPSAWAPSIGKDYPGAWRQSQEVSRGRGRQSCHSTLRGEASCSASGSGLGAEGRGAAPGLPELGGQEKQRALCLHPSDGPAPAAEGEAAAVHHLGGPQRPRGPRLPAGLHGPGAGAGEGHPGPRAHAGALQVRPGWGGGAQPGGAGTPLSPRAVPAVRAWAAPAPSWRWSGCCSSWRRSRRWTCSMPCARCGCSGRS